MCLEYAQLNSGTYELANQERIGCTTDGFITGLILIRAMKREADLLTSFQSSVNIKSKIPSSSILQKTKEISYMFLN